MKVVEYLRHVVQVGGVRGVPRVEVVVDLRPEVGARVSLLVDGYRTALVGVAGDEGRALMVSANNRVCPLGVLADWLDENENAAAVPEDLTAAMRRRVEFRRVGESQPRRKTGFVFEVSLDGPDDEANELIFS